MVASHEFSAYQEHNMPSDFLFERFYGLDVPKQPFEISNIRQYLTIVARDTVDDYPQIDGLLGRVIDGKLQISAGQDPGLTHVLAVREAAGENIDVGKTWEDFDKARIAAVAGLVPRIVAGNTLPIEYLDTVIEDVQLTQVHILGGFGAKRQALQRIANATKKLELPNNYLYKDLSERREAALASVNKLAKRDSFLGRIGLLPKL